jgi:uncharacterized membrane protein YedE/YeeE
MNEIFKNKENIVSLAAGLLFGIGLAISGMTQPGKVIGFLDFTGNWDPSLIFVMGGGTTVYMILYQWIIKHERPLYAPSFQIPNRKDVDRPLVIGAVLFGLGWGLGGFCPGPGLTSLFSGNLGAVLFVIGMTGGMLVAPTVEKKLIPKAAQIPA